MIATAAATAAKARRRRGQIRAPRGHAPPRGVDLDRLGHVLRPSRPEPHEVHTCHLTDAAYDRRAHVDGAGFGHALEPGRDVDPIAEHVAVGDDHVAEIEADPQVERPRSEAFLNRDGGSDGLHHAAESSEEAVAGGLEDLAVVLLDRRHGDIGEGLAYRIVGAGVVIGHEAAVTHDIGGQDGGEPALHESAPPCYAC